MTDANPLVAQRQSSTTAYTGIGIVESAAGIFNDVEGRSWLDTGLTVAGGGLETLSLVLDPIGTLGEYAVSWLIEHIQPLRDALDWLAGDPDQISAYAQTWRNVSQSVGGVAQDFTSEVGNGTAGWTGEAADAYRAIAQSHGEHMTAASSGAGTVGSAVELIGVVVGAVREIVKQLVATCISTLLARLPAWLAEAGLTLGLATPVIVSQAASLIARWVDRVKDFLLRLTQSMSRLRGILGKLDELWAAIRRGLTAGARSVSDASTTAMSAVRNRVSYEVGAFRKGWSEARALETAPAVHLNGNGTLAMSTLPNSTTSLADRAAAFRAGRQDYVHELKVDGARYPESALHIKDAQTAGHPNILTMDNSPNAKINADARREASLRDYPTRKGFDRDEYPPARTYEGGDGASVRYIDPKDNQGSGSSWWRWGVSGLPDRARVKVTPINVE